MLAERTESNGIVYTCYFEGKTSLTSSDAKYSGVPLFLRCLSNDVNKFDLIFQEAEFVERDQCFRP